MGEVHVYGERPHTRSKRAWKRFRAVRVLVAFVMAMALSGLGHAAEEAVEAAVHVADTGHGPHAEHHPEGEADRGTEHYCFGAVHNCGCCPSAVAAATHSTILPVRAARHVGHAVDDDDVPVDGIRKRIERPPRA